MKISLFWSFTLRCRLDPTLPPPWAITAISAISCLSQWLKSMDQISIKTPKPKCCLYWCLIEFTDWRYSRSCLYFRPLLWTCAPSNLLTGSPTPTLELCSLKMKTWTFSRSYWGIPNPRALETCTWVLEVHPESVKASTGAMRITLDATQTHTWGKETCPGTIKIT